MPWILFSRAFIAVAIAVLGGAGSSATTGGHNWYVDCASGDDDADGLSPPRAWRTTARVSAKSLMPGDTVLFRRGGACSGMLSPRGSGVASAPIRLDAFGSGPLPRIEAGRGDKAALLLNDQQYWTIQHLEFSGGNPYGIFITGTSGVLHGIHIRDVVIHDVTGEPKSKESGLLVISPGSPLQRFDDVLVDGVTAYHTTQWAGIIVGGDSFGYRAEKDRSTNVVVRNSIVADVGGDGIVLFAVNKGLIENSVAWYTGMQHTEKTGTPNAIWTWMCGDCTVRRSEAFLTDSPGVDGGAFDIDYGDQNNTVEESYGHDTQGYCIAVFGAEWVTTGSVVRNNVCSGNGRSPRLARRQGAIFLETWNGGALQGVEFTGNRIFWNPPIAVAAIVNTAKFIGQGSFENNTLESAGAPYLRSNSAIRFDRNTYRYSGTGRPKWEYGSTVFTDFASWQTGSGQDKNSSFGITGSREAKEIPCSLTAYLSTDPDDHDSRGQLALLMSVHRQFPNMPVRIIAGGNEDRNLRFDWHTGDLPLSFETSELGLPVTIITDRTGKIIWRHDGITPPGDLGLAIRSIYGAPNFSEMTTLP